ncbi:DUF4267 domain-containing protein [Litoribrevibacter albus]|uniref:DUF4267 domain-containing protein n=1 Tax=Litoribrevibacter albus TaxID=1473156 RepID=A0AA37SA44_9GAMM|nr:DUF4267 domain-containing protein [Litoribrevibacter albus]GLQ30887.1 hypothetical protein GCM10007876_13660 [Litoribrevibacter albus]
MNNSNGKLLEKLACVLVFLMAALQGAYAIFSYVDPAGFSLVRGTELFSLADSDWVQIYASRTLFVALIIGYLLYLKNYQVLAWAALFGTVMPITDAYLAYEAQAENKVVIKHIATVTYLAVTFVVLNLVVKSKSKSKRDQANPVQDSSVNSSI